MQDARLAKGSRQKGEYGDSQRGEDVDQRRGEYGDRQQGANGEFVEFLVTVLGRANGFMRLGEVVQEFKAQRLDPSIVPPQLRPFATNLITTKGLYKYVHQCLFFTAKH
jgi:hypothetical protein